jgi:DNA (cytosine-5)-methyltransferase 1
VNELALFAGAGGGILGGTLLGWRAVCAVEIDPYCASVLACRQNEGFLPPFPIWDDVRTFDGRPWRGLVDVVSGGFPCTDISIAGKGDGIEGEQSGLWVEMARIIREVRPRYAFVENSPMLTSRGLDRVLGDLAEMGFNARWGVVSAADVGAPHRRERIWIVADSMRGRFGQGEAIDKSTLDQERDIEAFGERRASISSQTRRNGGDWDHVADADGMRELQPEGGKPNERGRAGDGGCSMGNAVQPRFQDARQESPGAHWRKSGRTTTAASWWSIEPCVGRVADGVPARVDQLKALGNGQVPLVAATAWRLLTS